MNVKVWVCMTCHQVHFNPNSDYVECINDSHAMYIGFIWPAKEDVST